MRTQYCRQHIKKTAEECDLGDDIVSEVERVDKFCGSNPAFADCATRPIYRLISERDIEVRNKAILSAEIALNEETPTGGKTRTKLTEPEIIGFIRKARREIHGESEKAQKPETAKEKPTVFPEHVPPAAVTVPLEADPAKPVHPSLAAQQAAKDNTTTTAVSPVLITDTTGKVSPDADKPDHIVDANKMIPEWSPIVCRAGNCPDNKNHYRRNPVKNRLECDLLGVDAHQISHCPIIDRMKKAETGGFVPASQYDPLTGGRLIKAPGIKIVATPVTKEQAEQLMDQIVRGYFTKKEQVAVSTLIQTKELGDTPLELFQALVLEAEERMGGA